jgi:AcrR family transcriptional regulator
MSLSKVSAADATTALAPPTTGGRPSILDSDTVGRRPVSAKGWRTRARLVTAARTVFERDGFLKARVADIATEAGVSHGTFYTYFDTKAEIFRVIVADVMYLVWHAGNASGGEQDLTALQRIERGNRRFIEVYRENGSMLGLMEQAVTYDEDVRDIRLAVRRVSVERIRRSVVRMQEMGLASKELDPPAAAGALVSMVSNFVYFWLIMGEGDYTDDAAVRTLTRLWASAVGLDADLP